jgi:hypothetical protein
VKLKSELGILVDTQLWTAAVQDIKVREKNLKSKKSELDIEIRLRNSDLVRLQSDLVSKSVVIKCFICRIYVFYNMVKIVFMCFV